MEKDGRDGEILGNMEEDVGRWRKMKEERGEYGGMWSRLRKTSEGGGRWRENGGR